MSKETPGNRALEAIASSLEGDCCKQNQSEVLGWLQSDSGNFKKYNQYKQILNVSKGGEERFDKTKAFEKINRILPREKGIPKRLFENFIRVAAVFAIVWSSVFGYNNFFQQHSSIVLNFETVLGNRTKTTLPDGSVTKLNAGTRMAFTSEKNKRRVELSGEAFFKVANSEKPFFVKTKNQTIKVYGTEFNVEAYEDDDLITTTLKEGSIGLQIEGTKEYVLKPGEQAVYSINTGELNIFPCDVKKSMAWLENRMILRGVTFGEVSRKLERRYKTQIIFEKEEIQNYHFSGSFEDETVEEIIQTLCKVSKSTYKKDGSVYHIY